jgi:hypothetical protein
MFLVKRGYSLHIAIALPALMMMMKPLIPLENMAFFFTSLCLVYTRNKLREISDIYSFKQQNNLIVFWDFILTKGIKTYNGVF